jgi:hypothetical protein
MTMAGIRRALAVLVTGLLVAGIAVVVAPATVEAGVPQYQRVITARSALPTAALVAVEGCIRTEVWADSSDNVFGGRPGRVNKQGLTSVLVVGYDTCTHGLGGSAAGGGGDPGTVIFEGFGQTLDRLRSTPRFDRAWIDATLPVVDEVSGETLTVRLALTWTLVGEFDRDTGHSHVRFPHEGIVNSHTQTLTGDALVSGEVSIGADRLTFPPTGGAVLSQVKSGCQVIVFPHASGTDLSC